MESEDKKPIFTRKLLLWLLLIILIIIIIILLLRRCGKGGNEGGGEETASVTITPSRLSLAPEETYTLRGHTNTDYDINWSSNDPSCVNVEGYNTEAIVQAGKSECTAEITARTPDAQDTITVDVIKKLDELEGLQLNKSTYTVRVGKTVLASVTAVPTTAELPALYYEIEDTSIAIVSDTGVIKGVKVGTTKLIVSTATGISATSKVKVVKATGPDEDEPPTHVDVSKIEFDKNNKKEVCVDSVIPISVIVSPNNATDKTILWELDNPTDKTKMVNAYAKIDSKGLLTGIKAGTVEVTAISKDNSKLVIKTKITVLSKSSSKCNGGGGPVVPYNPDDDDDEDGSSTTSTAAMTCKVNYKEGKNGWYTKYNVTWTYTGLSLSDDGYTDRKYCIGSSCNPMPGTRYYYAPGDGKTETKFYYSYKDKDGNTKKADCSPSPLKKLDSKAPTCAITSKRTDNWNVEIKVTASDAMSGVKLIYLNDKLVGNYSSVYDKQEYTTEETIDGKKLYSAIVYDEAGNSGTCSAVITADGEEDLSTKYDVSAYINTYGLTTLYVDETYSIRGYFKETDGSIRLAKDNEVKVSGPNYSVGSGVKNISITPKNTGDLTVTITGKDSNGKAVTASAKFTVVKKDDVSISVSMSPGSGTKSKKTETITATATPSSGELPSDFKLTICASTSEGCTPNVDGSKGVAIDKTGKYYVYYSYTSKELQNVTGKSLGWIIIDKDTPTCSANKSPDGKTATVFLKDVGSGIAKYQINSEAEKTVSGTFMQYTINNLSASKYIGATVKVTDNAGNTGSCVLSDLKSATLQYLNINPNPLTMYTNGTATIVVTAVDTDGKINSSLRGVTVTKTGDCFTATGDSNGYNVEVVSKSTSCNGTITVTSKYDTSISASVDVIVKQKPKEVCTIRIENGYIYVTPSGLNGTIKTFYINGSLVGHSDNETVKVASNGATSAEATINYANGAVERCSIVTGEAATSEITLSPVTFDNGKTGSATATTKGNFKSYKWSIQNSTCAKYDGTPTGTTATLKAVDGLTKSCSTYIWITGTLADGTTKQSNTVKVTVNVAGSSTPKPVITISEIGDAGWKDWVTADAGGAKGNIQVTGIQSGYTVKITCTNAQCGKVDNTATAPTLQRGFGIYSNTEATISVEVYDSTGNKLASKSEKHTPTKVDAVKPTCDIKFIDGSTSLTTTSATVKLKATVTEKESGVDTSSWTGSNGVYTKYVSGSSNQTLTIKDKAGNQGTCSAKVNVSTTYSCSGGYSKGSTIGMSDSVCVKYTTTPQGNYSNYVTIQTDYVAYCSGSGESFKDEIVVKCSERLGEEECYDHDVFNVYCYRKETRKAQTFTPGTCLATEKEYNGKCYTTKYADASYYYKITK